MVLPLLDAACIPHSRDEISDVVVGVPCQSEAIIELK